MSAKRSFSLEFSPVKLDQDSTATADMITTLDAHKPELMTVTYGAGGSTKDGTFETLRFFQEHTDCPLACHLTHISSTKADLDVYLDRLWETGIHHIVALRGDMPKDTSWQKDTSAKYYNYTDEFVRAIVRRHPFSVSVGAYPEKHPDSPTMEHDVMTLKKKCDEGASNAFTQFFFDNDLFYRFRDATQKAGIEVPVIPGLMRVLNIKRVESFASKIGATVPQSLKHTFENAADPAAIAEETLYRQVEDLKRNGVEKFHFYTMNRSHGMARSLKHALEN